MKVETKNTKVKKLFIKKCHMCGHLMEGTGEFKKCGGCHKSFLPLNYFAKIHDKHLSKIDHLYAKGHELHEEDLILGLNALW